jgi:hypothetical protein
LNHFLSPDGISLISIIGNNQRKSELRLENLNDEKKERYTLPYTVTSVTSVTKFLKCPECKFKNIYPETVEHHIKHKHGQNDRQGAN